METTERTTEETHAQAAADVAAAGAAFEIVDYYEDLARMKDERPEDFYRLPAQTIGTFAVYAERKRNFEESAQLAG